MKRFHEIKITDYKNIYGLLDIVEKFHHKCKLCEKIILLDADDLKNHLQQKHMNTQLQDYNKRYMIYSTTRQKKKDYNMKKHLINVDLIEDLIKNNEMETLDNFPSNWNIMEDLNAGTDVFSIAYDEIFDQK